MSCPLGVPSRKPAAMMGAAARDGARQALGTEGPAAIPGGAAGQGQGGPTVAVAFGRVGRGVAVFAILDDLLHGGSGKVGQVRSLFVV